MKCGKQSTIKTRSHFHHRLKLMLNSPTLLVEMESVETLEEISIPQIHISQLDLLIQEMIASSIE